MDDWELLQAYSQHGSESAFQRLVERYVAQVHSMATRQMGDTHRAQDVTQAVFLILVRKAGTLSRKTVLSGWLFNATRHVARTALRGERRRKEREMQAIACSITEPDAAAASKVEAHLDDALASLGESDRNAVLLRYIQQRSVQDVAASLGTSQEAAQKRIERAVEKLRRFFGGRGVAVPAVTLMGVVSAQAVQPVPPLLVQGIVALGVPSAPAVSAVAVGLMQEALKTMLLSKLMAPGSLGVAALVLMLPVVGFLASSRPEPRAVYDLSTDFSVTANPGEVWSYGWKTSFADTCTPLTVRYMSYTDQGDRIPSWQLTSSQTPAIYKNMMANSVTVGRGAATLAPGTVWFLPGEDGRPENFGIIQFAVPSGGAGMYRVEASVAPNYLGPPQGDSDFHVLLNGTELFGKFLSPADSAGYTNTLRLAEGDKVEFAVGRGADGRQFGSVLSIHARLEGPRGPVLAAKR